MQPHPVTSVMQLAVTFCAVCIAAASIIFTVATLRQERNAALVSIGVSILRADPKKEFQTKSTREWALDLIDANAGGVKFSDVARSELIEHRLDYSQPISEGYVSGGVPDFGTPRAGKISK